MRLWRDSFGGVALEFAILAPVMLFTLIGMFDFARMQAEDARVANAALAGIHYGMQSAAHAGDYPGIVTAARAGSGDPGLEVTAERSCRCPDGGPIACTDACVAGGRPEMSVRVDVRREFRTMIDYPFVANPVQLSRTAETRVE